jgi:two-component system cell cycle response regulator DivK
MSNDSVLIVEDTPVNLKLVEVLLSRNGFDVRTAKTAEDALEVLKQFTPRLVLTDIALPGMDGVELIRRLKSDPTKRDTVVLALTAFAMKGDEEKAFQAGCDGYITKPIDTRTFPALIRQYLSRGHETPNDALPASPPEAADTELSLREIRQSFVAEGVQLSKHLISTFGAGFDYGEAKVTAHRWAGAGGSVGCPEISRNARELEAVLQQNGSGSSLRTRELLIRLARLFSEAMRADQLRAADSPEEVRPPQPNPQRATRGVDKPPGEARPAVSALGPASPHQEVASSALLSTLAGKRFGLAGFQQAEAARLAQALDACQAFSRDLGADFPDAETLRPFDLIILNVASEVKSIPQWNKPVLAIGPREILLRLQPIHNGAEDFLFSPWTAEEVMLRSCFAISRDAQVRQAQAAPLASGKRRVVIADDDSTIRALVEAAVQNSGFECRLAGDGGAALEIIRSWQPDLAVLDVNMPNRNGFEVLSSLRNDPLTSNIRVILLTARQQETDVIRGFGLGADDYVIKPFSPMELIARLKRLLGKTA